MAHQPKAYKKFVATAATATLVASAIAPVASAATPNFTDVSKAYQDAVNYLVENGIANGTTETTFGTSNNISRGDAAVMIANALKLDTENAKDAGFQDVNARVAGSVNAIVEAGIASGKTATAFDPAAYITRQEMAKMLANAYKLTAKENANFKDVNNNWIGYVSALKEAGITLGKTETTFAPTENLTRGEFALFMFRAEGGVVGEVALTSTKAINAKTIELTFNKAVDTEKAKFELKKGTTTVNVAKTTFSDDKKSVQLELASKLFEGEYTVNVSGLTEEKLTGSVKVVNEHVAKIELLSESAPKTGDATATVGYRVTNQYGENITESPLATSIDWNTMAGFTADDDNKGVLTITNTGGDFKVGDKVVVTGINSASNTVVTGTLTVTNAAVADTVSFNGVYHAEGKELAGNSTIADFKLLVDVKDQYGNPVNAAKVNSDVLFTSSNESLIKVGAASDKQGKNKNQVGLALTFGNNASHGGKAVITAISKSTGKVSQYELTVKASPKLDVFSMTAPVDIVAAGDTVKIPFTAADQFGNAITKEKDLKSVVTFSGTYGANAPVIKADDKGDAYIEYTPDTKGTKVIIASFNGKVSQLNLNVVEAANPVTIESLKDVTTTVAKNGVVKIGLADIVVKDEYGRTVNLKDKLSNTAAAGKYRIVAEDTAEGAVKVEGSIDANDAQFTITGLSKGTEEVTFKLQKSNGATTPAFEDVVTSPLKVTFTTVEKSAFTSYEVADVATLYADGTETTHTRALNVYGVKADGTKVILPASDYTVITDTKAVTYSNGKLNAVYSEADIWNTFAVPEITSKVSVVVDGADAPTTLTKEVAISAISPKADVIEFTSAVKNGTATVATTDLAGAGDAAKLKAVLKVTDQYGVSLTSIDPKITITNLKDNSDNAQDISVTNNGTSTVNIENAGEGDTFTASYLLDGKSVSVKFKVTAPTAP